MTVKWVTVLALVCASLGCSSSDETSSAQTDQTNRWSPSETRSSQSPTGLLIEPKPAADIGFRLGWASPIDLLPEQKITSVSVLDDIVIIIEDPENLVTALRADNGELLWKINLGSRLESLFKPSRDGDQIFIHSGTRFWTLATRDGEVKAVAPLETSVSSPGVYSAERRITVFTGSNGLVFGHSVVSNFSRWRYRLASQISNSPVLVGQDVFVVDNGGTYALIETSTGMPLWRNRTLGDVSSAPTAQGSEVIVASQDGKLYAFNRTTGRDTWQYLGAEQPLSSAPVALGRLIIQPLLPNGGIVAVNSINGEEVWRTDISATPIITREQDMLLHTDNELVAIDLDDGETTQAVPTLPIMTVVPIGDSGAIILVSANGRLLRLSPH